MALQKMALACGLLMMSTAALPQGPASGPENATSADRASTDAQPDTPGTGPFPAIKEVDPSLPDHVVYRPADLAKLGGRKLGVLVWGNGGCAADGASARFHLLEIASHGYLVIAPGKIMTGGARPPRAPAPNPAQSGAPLLPPIATTAKDVAAGIDWALAENGRAGSRYEGLIDAKEIAVGGHSCGGLQALQIASDPRIRTVLVHNSGVFTDGSNPIQGIRVDKSILKTVHTSIIYFIGGKSDIAYPNGTDDYARITHVPAVLVDSDVGHGGTFGQPNGGRVAQLAVNWLDWQLRGDKEAAKTFVGADCRLCADPKWTIQRKGF